MRFVIALFAAAHFTSAGPLRSEDVDLTSGSGGFVPDINDKKHNDFEKRDNSSGAEFTVAQISNPNYEPLDGPGALLKAYARYSDKAPPGMEEAVKTNPTLNAKYQSFFSKSSRTGTVAAIPDPSYDSEYVIPVNIGTPGQKTYLNLDTGSSDLWSFSTDTYPPSANGHSLYDPGASRTSKRLPGQIWSILYGDGSGANGIVYTDRVQLGTTFVEAQAVQSAIQVSPDIAADKFASGIIGMAFDTANSVRPTQQKTYFDNVQSHLALPLFAVDLHADKPGSYDFGFVDRTKFTGALSWTPVIGNTPFWKVAVGGYRVGNASYKTYSWPAIVDTGTSLLLAPQAIVDAYYKEVSGASFDPFQGMMTFPCTATLPDFTFGVGVYRGVIAGKYLNYGAFSKNQCWGGIQSSDGIGFSILGDVALKAQYVAFDIRSKSVGFANKA